MKRMMFVILMLSAAVVSPAKADPSRFKETGTSTFESSPGSHRASVEPVKGRLFVESQLRGSGMDISDVVESRGTRAGRAEAWAIATLPIENGADNVAVTMNIFRSDSLANAREEAGPIPYGYPPLTLETERNEALLEVFVEVAAIDCFKVCVEQIHSTSHAIACTAGVQRNCSSPSQLKLSVPVDPSSGSVDVRVRLVATTTLDRQGTLAEVRGLIDVLNLEAL